jgi:hypothetical protein
LAVKNLSRRWQKRKCVVELQAKFAVFARTRVVDKSILGNFALVAARAITSPFEFHFTFRTMDFLCEMVRHRKRVGCREDKKE